MRSSSWEAANYANAGTVEFLVAPESGKHYFIECNPRIQVEHTGTEQVTGVDLVEAQFHIAAGASLASLGLDSQQAIGAPRGFAVQARVVARGAGTLSAYKEPTGPGVRVDGNGYMGYAPPPQFDPLLAKVIASSSSSAGSSYAAAVDRTRRALDEFHIGGLATNLEQLKAILAHPAVRTGDARTTLLSDEPTLLAPAIDANGNGALALLQQQATVMGVSTVSGAGVAPTATSCRRCAGGEHGAGGGRLSDGRIRAGVPRPGRRCGQCRRRAHCHQRDEDGVPSLGTLRRYRGGGAAVSAGDSVEAGQVFAVIEPKAGAERIREKAATTPGRTCLRTVATMQSLAHERLEPGSEDPGVVRQRSRGKLTCRERIDLLLDDGSFREVGSVAGFASYDEDGNVTAFTPANHVGGSGKIEGRSVVVCADDFTSRGGHSDGAIGAKSGYIDRLSIEMRIPSIRLLDGSSGGGSVASMVPAQKKEGERQGQGRAAAPSRPPSPRRRWRRSFLPGPWAAPCIPTNWARCRS